MKKIAIQIAGVVLFIIICTPDPSYGSWQEVSINVTPLVSFVINDQRVYLRVTIRLERHPDNRLISFGWDSPDGEAGSSQKYLEGENSPIIFTGEDFLGRAGLSLPVGHYLIKVILLRIVNGEEKRFLAQTTIKVVRAGEEEEDHR